ncbi:MAG: hypothetical protein R3E65_03345 [Steroidobacteraceae bacterium]
MSSRRFLLPWAALAALLTAPALPAHEIWFERERGEMVLVYGDFGVNMRERTPGGNDRFGQLTARHLGGQFDVEVPLTPQPDHFSGVPTPRAGESLVAWDDYYRIFDELHDGKRVRSRWIVAARYVPDLAVRAPRLALDVVPTGRLDGDRIELQVWFNGEPLPEATVLLYAASGWRLEQQADEEGRVWFSLPWKGLYAATVLRYIDATPGERRSEPVPGNPLRARPSETATERYDRTSHTTTLTFYQSRGLRALPKPPPTLPASML